MAGRFRVIHRLSTAFPHSYPQYIANFVEKRLDKRKRLWYYSYMVEIPANNNTFNSENFATLRRLHEQSQEEFGKLLTPPLSRFTISNIESGKCSPRVSALEQLAQHFSIEISFFFISTSQQADLLTASITKD